MKRRGSRSSRGSAASSPSKKSNKTEEMDPNLRGEWGSIFWLVILYILQGVPMGLAASVPLILKERNVSFSDLGTFSLNSWPFSLKLLWAPFVDSLYIERFGRRKSWLIPVQVLIGLTMFAISFHLDEWMGDSGEVQIMALTGSFFFLYFLAATQDIAVDGWALTMLRPENVGYASTCNSAGQIAGFFLTFTGTLAFQHFKILTLSEFMNVCGMIFVGLTLCVALFKREINPIGEEVETPREVYRQVASCMKMPAVRSFAIMLLLWKLPFAANDALVGLKAQEAGFSKEMMASLSVLVTPLMILVPLFVGKMTAGPTPLDVARKVFLPRIVAGLIGYVIIQTIPASIKENKEIGMIEMAYYSFVFVFSCSTTILGSAFFSSYMSFFAKISDKNIGGTYMTLLNTFGNMGGMWTVTFVLKSVDFFTLKSGPEEDAQEIVSGYGVLLLITSSLGFAAYPTLKAQIHSLQLRKISDWKIK